MHRIIKKTDYCSNCGFLDTNSFCRKGLGWKYIDHPEKSYCSDQWPIRPNRCGTCHWYNLDGSTTDSSSSRTCKRLNYYTSFFNCCSFYEHERGKNIRPKSDEVPQKLK